MEINHLTGVKNNHKIDILKFTPDELLKCSIAQQNCSSYKGYSYTFVRMSSKYLAETLLENILLPVSKIVTAFTLSNTVIGITKDYCLYLGYSTDYKITLRINKEDITVIIETL